MSDMDNYRPDECEHCGLSACCCETDADGPIVCAHNRTVGEFCAECDVAAEMHLAGMFDRILRRIQQEEDETTGAALAARFGGNR